LHNGKPHGKGYALIKMLSCNQVTITEIEGFILKVDPSIWGKNSMIHDDVAHGKFPFQWVAFTM
jgi:hypothetical protein